MLDNVRADFRAHNRRLGAQGFWALLVYRFGRWRIAQPRLVRRLLYPLYLFLEKLVQVVAGIELPCEVEIGEGFVIDHFGGIIISGYARFGNHCRIRGGCVVGLARICGWDEVDTLVVDAGLDDDARRHLAHAADRLVLASPAPTSGEPQ